MKRLLLAAAVALGAVAPATSVVGQTSGPTAQCPGEAWLRFWNPPPGFDANTLVAQFLRTAEIRNGALVCTYDTGGHMARAGCQAQNPAEWTPTGLGMMWSAPQNGLNPNAPLAVCNG